MTYLKVLDLGLVFFVSSSESCAFENTTRDFRWDTWLVGKELSFWLASLVIQGFLVEMLVTGVFSLAQNTGCLDSLESLSFNLCKLFSKFPLNFLFF